MAQSTFATRQYPSESFVESCGAVLFDLADANAKKVCLIHLVKEDEWYLAKGRRNCGEARKDAALREVMEETGYRCHLHPVTMSTRATCKEDATNIPDKSRMYPDLTEPFMFTLRDLNPGAGVKIIWWYIAALDEDAHTNRLPGEAEFRTQFFSCDAALEKLTFQTDREVLAKAIKLVEGC